MRTYSITKKKQFRDLAGGWNWKLPKTPTPSRGKWVFDMTAKGGKMNWIMRKGEK